MNLFHEAKKVLDKDGKVNPLGPYGKSKLTGREISTYFRRNPVKDGEIRKAVTVALDLEGAMDIAVDAIKKFYGNKILKSKEVQSALRYANESVQHKLDMVEDYRKLAKHGMGAETKNSIKVGTEIDYYRADGAKYMGKVIKMTPKGYIVKDDKNGKNYQFNYLDRAKAKQYLKQSVEEAVSPAQQAAIAISKKEKGEKPKNESVMDAYKNLRGMWAEAAGEVLDEKVANITVDPNNKKFNSIKDQNAAAQEVAILAKRSGLKVAYLGKNIRVVGNQKAVNDFLRVVIGRSRYGDPTEKDMTTPQIDKMLSKNLKGK